MSATPPDALMVVTPHKKPAPLAPKTPAQKRYMNAVRVAELVVAVGPAGTGKTYLPVAMAADALAAKETSKIIVTRPVVEAGESLGFLPGELDEKFEPYLAPVRAVLNERLGKSHVENLLKLGKIEPVPLAYMRGMTFRDCWVILDEAQNVSEVQMRMFLTRIGEGCKIILCGDTDQKDIAGPSGLVDALRRLRGIAGVQVVRFGDEDVVRSGLAKAIVKAYSRGERLEVDDLAESGRP